MHESYTLQRQKVSVQQLAGQKLQIFGHAGLGTNLVHAVGLSHLPGHSCIVSTQLLSRCECLAGVRRSLLLQFGYAQQSSF